MCSAAVAIDPPPTADNRSTNSLRRPFGVVVVPATCSSSAWLPLGLVSGNKPIMQLFTLSGAIGSNKYTLYSFSFILIVFHLIDALIRSCIYHAYTINKTHPHLYVNASRIHVVVRRILVGVGPAQHIGNTCHNNTIHTTIYTHSLSAANTTRILIVICRDGKSRRLRRRYRNASCVGDSTQQACIHEGNAIWLTMYVHRDI